MSEVEHPNHYKKKGRKECVVELEEKYSPQIAFTYYLTSAYKYLYRAGNKEGVSADTDIAKAKNCLAEADRMLLVHKLPKFSPLWMLKYDIEQEIRSYDRHK